MLAEISPNASAIYPLIGLAAGYVLFILFNPLRSSLRDGFRCIYRYKRIWLAFVLFGFGYSVFQFAAFTQVDSVADFDLTQLASLPSWHWPRLAEVWMEVPLPTLEAVAGIFDNATTTYPLSVIAAALMLFNWRGLHASLWQALQKRFRIFGYPIYLVVLVSALAALLKPVVFWGLPKWGGIVPAVTLLQISATVDAVSFIFEYLFGVYIQVYLIMLCLVWVRGLSFDELSLFQFAVRRFSYVLEWALIVVAISTLFVRVPLLLAYFMKFPGVLDFLPWQRMGMSLLIIAFASMQVSLALHNETIGEAFRSHREFVVRNRSVFFWFLLVCAIHFLLIMGCDALARGAIGDRLVPLVLWKSAFVCLRGLITGWLLATWVCLFRQCETGRLDRETWIRY